MWCFDHQSYSSNGFGFLGQNIFVGGSLCVLRTQYQWWLGKNLIPNDNETPWSLIKVDQTSSLSPGFAVDMPLVFWWPSLKRFVFVSLGLYNSTTTTTTTTKTTKQTSYLSFCWPASKNPHQHILDTLIVWLCGVILGYLGVYKGCKEPVITGVQKSL